MNVELIIFQSLCIAKALLMLIWGGDPFVENNDMLNKVIELNDNKDFILSLAKRRNYSPGVLCRIAECYQQKFYDELNISLIEVATEIEESWREFKNLYPDNFYEK